MSVQKNKVIATLSPPLPNDIVTQLLDDYQQIKQQFFLRKFRPSELDGGRFAESVLRLIEFQDIESPTAYGKTLNSEQIIKRAENNTSLHESERIHIPRLCRVLLDIRNKRDVAHPVADINPNYSDALFIAHATDWILTELIRLHYQCSLDEARSIVAEINQVSIPLVDDVDGFLRVQNEKMVAQDKVLVLLYYKDPEKVRDTDLAKWLRYQNLSRFQKELLIALDKSCMIHYHNGYCTLLTKGKLFVEKNFALELLL